VFESEGHTMAGAQRQPIGGESRGRTPWGGLGAKPSDAEMVSK